MRSPARDSSPSSALRPQFFIFLVLLVAIVFARPLAKNEVFTFRDHTDYFQPLRWFTTITLRSGNLPLWNAFNASGEPWLANPQTGVFYPPAWLFLILPFATAYMLFLALHLVLLACGAFLLFSRRAPPGAALIGAVALTFCGPTLSLLDVQNNLTTFAWLPLVLWCAFARVSPAWSAAAIAMSFLAGEPFFATCGALLFAIIRRREILQIAMMAAGIAAIQLVPFLELMRGSDRVAHLAPQDVLRDSTPLRDWLRVAVPPSVSPNGFDPHLGQHFIPIVYLGVITAVLALIGIVAARRRALGWLALLLVAIVVAAGAQLPFIAVVLEHLPVTLFRYPARLVPLGALAVIALAVEGWSAIERFLGSSVPRTTSAVELRGTSRSPRNWLAAVVALALFADLVVHALPLLATAPMFSQPVPYDRAIGRDAKIVRVVSETRFSSDRAAWISGYLNLYDRRFDAWTAAPVVSQRYTDLYESARRGPSLRPLEEMSAGYFLATGVRRDLVPLARAGGVIAQRDPRALPLAYARDDAGRITPPELLSFGPSFVHAVVNVAAPSMFIVTQQSAPGWRVAIDGVRATPLQAGVFRAVRIASGRHEIVWSYRPVSLMAGAILTFVTMVAMPFRKKFVKR